MSDIEHYRLKSLDQGQYTGAFIATHAVKDGFFMMHCGVGCKHKATSQLTSHDYGKSAVFHGWTEVGDAELIEGAGPRIGPYMRSWYERIKPGMITCISVTFLDLTGDDVIQEVKEAGDPLPCRVLFAKVPGHEGDLFSGYAEVTLAVAKGLDWKVPTDPKSVCIAGYFFDRYEGDHVGNLGQISTLLRHLGLTMGSVLFSGSPYAAIEQAPKSGIMLAFPYVNPKVKRLKRFTKRDPVSVDLPVGLAGTAQWLRTVGGAAGVNPRHVEAVIEQQRARVLKRLEIVHMALGGLRVAVFADLPNLAGLVHVLADLRCQPVLLGIRAHWLGGINELKDTLARAGAALPEEATVLENPSLRAVREGCQTLIEQGEVDVIIGSSTEINVVATLPMDTVLEVGSDGEWTGRGPRVVEFGFPCTDFHVVRPSPFMGYAGVLTWADRLLNAPRLWDTRRN